MYWLLTLMWVIILWVPQNCQHEGAHALMARYLGVTVIKFWPLPGRNASGKFVFAHVRYDTKMYVDLPLTKKAFIAIAPVPVNLFMLIVSTIFFVIWPCQEWLLVIIVVNAVDLGNNIRLFIQGRGDIRKAFDFMSKP